VLLLQKTVYQNIDCYQYFLFYCRLSSKSVKNFVESNFSERQDEKQNVEAVIGVGRDITRQKHAEQGREKLVVSLQEALDNVKTLSGLVPICSHCKQVRDDEGYWNQIECHIEKHSYASFSHGMCPECSDELYGDEDWYIKMKQKKKR
jgi:hypothetical protein